MVSVDVKPYVSFSGRGGGTEEEENKQEEEWYSLSWKSEFSHDKEKERFSS